MNAILHHSKCYHAANIHLIILYRHSMQNVDIQHFKQFVKYHTFCSFFFQPPPVRVFLNQTHEVGFAKQTLFSRVGYTDSVG